MLVKLNLANQGSGQSCRCKLCVGSELEKKINYM